MQVLEETGITISNVRFAAAENVVFPTGQHYVVIFMQGQAAEVRGCAACYASNVTCHFVHLMMLQCHRQHLELPRLGGSSCQFTGRYSRQPVSSHPCIIGFMTGALSGTYIIDSCCGFEDAAALAVATCYKLARGQFSCVLPHPQGILHLVLCRRLRQWWWSLRSAKVSANTYWQW